MLNNDSENGINNHDDHRDVIDLARLLQESQDRNQVIIEQSPIAIEIYNSSGELNLINSACAKLFGIKSINEVKNFSLFDDPNVSNEHKQSLNSKESIRYEAIFDFDKVNKLKLYNTWKSGQIWLDTLITPTLDKKNKITGYLVYIQDITNQKNEENLIKEDGQRFRSYFNISSHGIAITSPEKGWLEVNEKICLLLGYDHDELIKKTWEELTYQDDIKDDINYFNKLVSGEINSYILEKRFIRKDKAIIWTEISISCVRNDDNSLKYAIAIIEDISKRKKMQNDIENRDNIIAKTLKASNEMFDYESDEIDYSKISESVLNISGATFVSFNVFDDNGRDFSTMAISGVDDKIIDISNMLGFELIGKKWDYDHDREAKIKNNKITEFEHIHDLTGSVLPHKIIFTLEKMFNIGKVYVIRISKNKTSIGDFTLIFTGNKILENIEMVELLSDQVGLNLYREKLERKNLESSERLQLATQAAKVGIWDFDVVNNRLIWDEQMYHLYGIKPDSFGSAYESWRAGLHPEDSERSDKEIQMALRGEKEFNTEFRVLWSNGEIRYIRAMANVIRDSSNKAIRMIGTNWDITEQKILDQKLIDSEAKTNAIVSSSLDAIVMMDNNANVVSWNNAAFKLTGYTCDEVIGKNLHHIIVSKKEHEKSDNINKFAQTGESDVIGKIIELPIRTKDGNVKEVELSVSSVRLFNKWHAVGIMRDISEKKKQDLMLAEKIDELEKINSVMTGRELKMIELKEEIARLKSNGS